MTDAVYSNKFGLQQSDTVRLIFMDERAPVTRGEMMDPKVTAEVVLSIPNARALRDLLVEHVKDDIDPNAVN
jgi:hypothetical protein